eukprot:gene19984-biopygen10083
MGYGGGRERGDSARPIRRTNMAHSWSRQIFTPDPACEAAAPPPRARWGVGIFRGFPGRNPARKSAPRAARPPPRDARPGRAERAEGTGGWSSFPTTVSGHRPVPSWRPVGGNGVQARGFKRNACFRHYDRGMTYKIRVFFAVPHCSQFATGGSKRPGNPGLAPRSEPPHARAPGAQILWEWSSFPTTVLGHP